jgi:hypothetical protein
LGTYLMLNSRMGIPEINRTYGAPRVIDSRWVFLYSNLTLDLGQIRPTPSYRRNVKDDSLCVQATI